MDGLWLARPGVLPVEVGSGDAAGSSHIVEAAPTCPEQPTHAPTLQPHSPPIGASRAKADQPPVLHSPRGGSGDGSLAAPPDSCAADSSPTPERNLPQVEQEKPHRSFRSRGPQVTEKTRRPQPQPYEVDEDDLLDQHVGYYLRHNAKIHARHAIQRKNAGVYQLDGREVTLEWQYATDPEGHGFLVVVDGPLKQPFSDYMEMTERNAEYDEQSVNRSSLSMIPKAQRMSFHDQHKVYTRLEAMKVAKEQAHFREQHADFLKDGVEAPDDLLHKYKKTIKQKLGESWQSGQCVNERMPAHFSDRDGGVAGGSRPCPPPPLPQSMHNVYAAEPMDVGIFSASPNRPKVYAAEPMDVGIFSCAYGGSPISTVAAKLSGRRRQQESPWPPPSLNAAQPWQQAQACGSHSPQGWRI